MANLPTAHASQRFGRKTIDFYAVTGEVVGADPRARTDERRIQDLDGARHTLRLMDKNYQLQPGDYASVLRLQPGPARRSRPVAVANPAGGGWARTHPGIHALLSRAGVARNLNWAMTVALFAIAALAIVWPYLHAFLAELAPATAAPLPAPDVFALAASALPGLEAWRWSDAAGWLTPLLEPAGSDIAAQSGAIVFAGVAAALAVTTYASRSWRLVWAPLFAGLAIMGAIGLDGPGAATGPALAVLGAGALLFIIGGFINRARDAVRLERRISMLAEHMMTQTPTEHVRAPRSAVISDAAAPAAAGAALREPSDDADKADPAPGAEADAASSDDEPSADKDAEESVGADDGDAHAEARTEDAAAPEPDPETDRKPEPAPDQVNDQASEPAPQAPAHSAAPSPANDCDKVEADGFVDPDLAVTSGADEPDAPGQEAVSAVPADESEEEARLRTDPRYAARAIVLPSPPPMPRREEAGAPMFAAPESENGEGEESAPDAPSKDEAKDAPEPGDAKS
ncbi:hypothetical protein F1654_07770 [Alkalicaulis satelles]|uniref:Uncharacterized protein n=1 Tax=Alkalicaulis satelles TaxID=2609175 RepID=A0A5M6ZHC0_9PROT|nr:hypothetical protein [Alkalicaulis satelles]KAA5803690.1 hypothetical protein F1654_07770 [Alkalicaulis satelles]